MVLLVHATDGDTQNGTVQCKILPELSGIDGRPQAGGYTYT